MENQASKDWIESIPKFVNGNGCWIPGKYHRDKDGYVRVQINQSHYYLHRISLLVYHNIALSDYSGMCCHSSGCDKSCFNPSHIRFGSVSDNSKDRVRDGNDHNASKERCPECGGYYTKYKVSHKPGYYYRRCRWCKNKKRRKL